MKPTIETSYVDGVNESIEMPPNFYGESPSFVESEKVERSIAEIIQKTARISIESKIEFEKVQSEKEPNFMEESPRYKINESQDQL